MPNSDTEPLAQTFVIQLRDKFSLVWDDANSFHGLIPPNFNYLLRCMTHTTPSDSCSLAPDINALAYLLTLPSVRQDI